MLFYKPGHFILSKGSKINISESKYVKLEYMESSSIIVVCLGVTRKWAKICSVGGGGRQKLLRGEGAYPDYFGFCPPLAN